MHGVVDLDDSMEYEDGRDKTDYYRGCYVVAYDDEGHLMGMPYSAVSQKVFQVEDLALSSDGRIAVTGYFYQGGSFDPSNEYDAEMYVRRSPLQIVTQPALGIARNRYDGFVVELNPELGLVDALVFPGAGRIRPRSARSIAAKPFVRASLRTSSLHLRKPNLGQPAVSTGLS